MAAALLIVLSWSTLALAVRKERLIEVWRPTHYDVQITLNEKLEEISAARVDIRIVAVKSLRVIDLDFGSLTVDSVLLNSKPIKYVHDGEKLNVTLESTLIIGKSVTVSVLYHGKPGDGLILKPDKAGQPSAIGDNWPDRVHHWIPVLDHPSAKASVTFNVTAPPKLLVIANGRFSKVETEGGGNRTWTYVESSRIPPYCMIIGVGDFAFFEPRPGSAVPLFYYVPQTDRELAFNGFAPATSALTFFSQKVAPYPYEKLALIIGATQFGGMENSSAIVFASGLFSANPSPPLSETYKIPMGTVSVVAHEIAHQWFGDSVTESTWADLWLSEGFATYFAGLFIENSESEEAFQNYLKMGEQNIFAYEAQSKAPIHDRDTPELMKLLNANNYQKGAWVLHMLRMRVGDANFFEGIRRYYQAHKESTANTEDLRVALEKSSSRNLKNFFQRWIYQSGHPRYELSSTWNPNRHAFELVLKQTQEGEPFLDPVPVRITSGSTSVDIKIQPASKLTKMTILLTAKPSQIEIDPRNTLLKEAKLLN